MRNAQNGVTAAGRLSPTISLGVAGVGHFAARLWFRTTRMMAERLINPMIARLRAGREVAELRRLDARELRDIGINCTDFPAIRQGTFRRANALGKERIIFNPESTRETVPKTEPTDVFRLFRPDCQWYQHYWFGD